MIWKSYFSRVLLRVFFALLIGFCFITNYAQTSNPDFEIIGIGIISDSCDGEWKERHECTDKLVNQFLLSHIDWESIDSMPSGKHRIGLSYDVNDNGQVSNITITSETPKLAQACGYIKENWPSEFRYLRQDGMKIVGRYSTFFSFYF